MSNQKILNKKNERMQTAIVLAPFVLLLVWNVVFFYTDWWEVYLKPIGLHTWFEHQQWLQSTYNGLETRIYQHDVDAQKYMVLICWGVLWAIVLGLFLLAMSIKWILYGNSKPVIQTNVKTGVSTYVLFFVVLMMLVATPYIYIVNYGEFTTSYVGKFVTTPGLASLIFWQFMNIGMLWFVPILVFLTVYLLISDCKKMLKKVIKS
ncbi:hypothetical protein [Hydrogenovibrio sp. JE_KL2]|uniref:hypothetical protein n=1 Tax=Hydrogenovibrio sp. JE_KL2 TaxID=2651188 RepID=UPI00128E2321|nr:hypothetical protein [Hydrogenovibrio sp. JE_KL2]MPQ75944.1 hypothetical protein [Hydrogenovibrio sp. JE_KL2]